MISGHIDKLDHTKVEGWAWNPKAPEERVELEILDGENCIARTRAANLRPDLVRAAVGDGHYGFSVPFPPDLFPLAVHRLSVRVAGTGQHLKNSPQTIHPPHGGSLASVTQWFEGRVEALARAAVEPGQLAPLYAMAVNALSRILEAESRLLEENSITPAGMVSDANLPARLKYVLERAQDLLKPFHVPGFARPSLSIIVVAGPGLAETHALLRSLVEGERMRDYEIIVVDGNGGSDLVVLPFLVQGGGIRFVKTPGRISVFRAFALGLAQARGEDIVCLSGVASVAPTAIAVLRETLRQRGDGAIVGARLLSREGRVIEAGSRLEAFGNRVSIGRYESAEAMRFRILRASDDVSVHGFALRRALLEPVGGFEAAEAFGSLGMTHLCLALREAGKEILVQGGASIVVDDAGPAMVPGIERAQFIYRWGSWLPRAGKSGAMPAAAPPRRALVIDELWPDAERDAASVAIISHAESLLRLGYDVEFLSTSPGGGTVRDAERLTLRGIFPVLGQENVTGYLKSREDQFDVVYLHRFVTARDYIAACRSTQPRARLIYNIADLQHLRLRRQAEVENNERLREESQVLEAQEIAAMEAVDIVITHSADEETLIRSRVKKARVGQVLWNHPQAREVAPFGGRSGMVFIGSYRHAPNVDAVTAFCNDLWPRIREKIEGAVFDVAGSHIEAAGFGTLGAGVALRGFVADAPAYLAQRRLMVAPLRFGAGVKGKFLLALSQGLPCITTVIGAEGIGLPPRLAELLVAADDDGFVQRVIRLYVNEGAWAEASEAGLAFAREFLSGEAIDRQLGALLAPAAQP
ncbi:MAG: glycosyltransferase [Beijerinckiaceae bacterium]|nr:glycosyltransferase [Beijerinckiaceae bacterium]